MVAKCQQVGPASGPSDGGGTLVASLGERGFGQPFHPAGNKCPAWWGVHRVGVGVSGGRRAVR